jgi:hypothetical protein
MATKKNAETIVIQPVEKVTAEITIIGDSNLIVHAWSEKAKREMLDAQQGKKSGKKKEYKNPVADFIRSMYWLDGTPHIPDGATEEEAEQIFNDAIAKGARFGFPAVAIKKAAVSAAYRQGITKDKVSANGSFWLNGINDVEFVEIESDEPPVMREDMVRIGLGTADIRYRGEFRNWKCRCRISYLKGGVFSLENIISMINLGGFCCGLGEWRTEKGGISGAFHVMTNK